MAARLDRRTRICSGSSASAGSASGPSLLDPAGGLSLLDPAGGLLVVNPAGGLSFVTT
jgi:hypothetical protein